MQYWFHILVQISCIQIYVILQLLSFKEICYLIKDTSFWFLHEKKSKYFVKLLKLFYFCSCLFLCRYLLQFICKEGKFYKAMERYGSLESSISLSKTILSQMPNLKIRFLICFKCCFWKVSEFSPSEQSV